MAIKISELANLSAYTDEVYIPVVETAGNTLSTVKSTSLQTKEYVLGTIPDEVADLTANTIAQQTQIHLNTLGIIAANVGQIGYTDNAINVSNIGQIGYTDNAVNVSNIGQIGYTDNAIATAVNTSNIGSIGYINEQINVANIGQIGYTDNAVNVSNIGQIGYTNETVTQANVGMKGYVDAEVIAAGGYSNVLAEAFLYSSDIFINTSANISASQVNAGQVRAGQLNSAGNVLARNGVFNALTVNGIVDIGALDVNSGIEGGVASFASINNTPIGNATPSTGAFTSVTTPSITKSGTNGSGDVGQSGNRFNILYGKSTSAQYADLAEKYEADTHYEAGTVVMFGGEKEITLAKDETPRVAGVVSTEPAFKMNDTLAAEHVAMIALQGRVPCRVTGTIEKGDMLVSAGDGYAKATDNPKFGTVIGKAVQEHQGDAGIIEVVVGRL